MQAKIARLTKMRTVREGPKSLNQNALKYCERGPCRITISLYRSFPLESCQGIYNCWPKSIRRSGHFRQLQKAITQKTMTIRPGPAHFSNHSNFCRAFCCCVAGLFDRRVFGFLRLMPYINAGDALSGGRGTQWNAKSRLNSEYHLSTTDCQNLRPS